MNQEDLRSTNEILDDVCLDCTENIGHGIICEGCVIEKLKKLIKENSK